MDEIKTKDDAAKILQGMLGAVNQLMVSGYNNSLIVVALVNDVNRLYDWVKADKQGGERECTT
jgi:hypothetical protein